MIIHAIQFKNWILNLSVLLVWYQTFERLIILIYYFPCIRYFHSDIYQTTTQKGYKKLFEREKFYTVRRVYAKKKKKKRNRLGDSNWKLRGILEYWNKLTIFFKYTQFNIMNNVNQTLTKYQKCEKGKSLFLLSLSLSFFPINIFYTAVKQYMIRTKLFCSSYPSLVQLYFSAALRKKMQFHSREAPEEA